MMNYIWAFMLAIGIFFALINNELPAFTENLMNSCTNAVQFMLGLAGIMAVWTGIMKIAEESGLISSLSRKAMPIIKYLFPYEKDEETIALILMSFMANVFGAGNSATVFSLKAMERLDAENKGRPEASDEMCMFVAISMSMIQLVPITVMQIRTQLGSENPSSVIIPSLLVSTLSMLTSIAVCKLFMKRRRIH